MHRVLQKFEQSAERRMNAVQRCRGRGTGQRADERIARDDAADTGVQEPDEPFDCVDGEERVETLTYAGLETKARAVAATLTARGLAGERVLLLHPPGLEYIASFVGCLFARAVAVPARAAYSHSASVGSR